MTGPGLRSFLRKHHITYHIISRHSNFSPSYIGTVLRGENRSPSAQEKIRRGILEIINARGIPKSEVLFFLYSTSDFAQALVKESDTKGGAPFLEDGIEVFFINDASIETLQELSKTTGKWNKILHGFARVANSNETDFRITNIEQGSILLTLAAAAGTVVAIGAAINEVLKIINNSLQIKKTALDLKQMKNPDLNKAISELEKNAEINTTEKSIHIAKIIVNNYNASDENEVLNAVKYGCVNLIDFYNKGGVVRLKLSAEEQLKHNDLLDELKEASELRELNQKKLNEIDKGDKRKLTDKKMD